MSKLTTEFQIKGALLAGAIAARMQCRNVGRDYRYSQNPVEQAAYVFAYDKTMSRHSHSAYAGAV